MLIANSKRRNLARRETCKHLPSSRTEGETGYQELLQWPHIRHIHDFMKYSEQPTPKLAGLRSCDRDEVVDVQRWKSLNDTSTQQRTCSRCTRQINIHVKNISRLEVYKTYLVKCTPGECRLCCDPRSFGSLDRRSTTGDATTADWKRRRNGQSAKRWFHGETVNTLPGNTRKNILRNILWTIQYER